MSDHTPAPENRPERCGYLRAALRTLQIDASSAAKFYADPKYHASLLDAIRKIDRLAEAAIAEDDSKVESNRAEFERWAKRDDYRCAKCHRSAHYSNDAPGTHGHAYVPPAR